VSKASDRAAARGERWYVIDRKAACRLAFEEGMRLCSSASFRERLLAGTEPNWKGLAVLAKPEKVKVRADVVAFAQATEDERQGAFKDPPKKSFVEKVKQAYQTVLGA
jgi:hypothetical protein